MPPFTKEFGDGRRIGLIGFAADCRQGNAHHTASLPIGAKPTAENERTRDPAGVPKCLAKLKNIPAKEALPLRETIAAMLWLVRSPIEAFDAMLAKKPFRLILRIVFLGLSPAAAATLFQIIKKPPFDQISLKGSSLQAFVILGALVMAVMQWFFDAFLLAVFVRFFGGKLPFRMNLLIVGYAQTPYLFSLPALLFSREAFAIALLFCRGWSLLFLYVGIMRGYGFTRGRALAVLLFCQFFVPLLLILILMSMGGGVPG
jgi:hypothetical protein